MTLFEDDDIVPSVVNDTIGKIRVQIGIGSCIRKQKHNNTEVVDISMTYLVIILSRETKVLQLL